MATTDATIAAQGQSEGERSNFRMLKHGLRVFALLLFLLCAGFLVFAHGVSRLPPATARPADGIVALTGGEERIAEAVKLLANGRARRLLITGVHPGTSKVQLVGLNPQSAPLFRCCVDLDKKALDTRDNATETTIWARRQGFRSLIVVTSSYHMPRTLIELRQAMPDADFIPYPVRSPALRCEGWWKDRYTVWVLAREYVKLLTALSRFTAHWLLDGKSEQTDRFLNARMG